MTSRPLSDAGADTAVIASIDEVLSTARSVRRKLDFSRPVPPAVIAACIDVATQAPTGLGGENWRFVVATEPVVKQDLARIYRDVLDALTRERGITLKATQRALADRLHEFPALIVVCVDAPPPEPGIAPQVAFYGSILPAAWSLMLALRARDIGCTWTSLLSSRQDAVGAVLGIPPAVTQTVMLPIGYTKDARLRRAARRPAAEVTYWNRWGQPPPVAGAAGITGEQADE